MTTPVCSSRFLLKELGDQQALYCATVPGAIVGRRTVVYGWPLEASMAR